MCLREQIHWFDKNGIRGHCRLSIVRVICEGMKSDQEGRDGPVGSAEDKELSDRREKQDGGRESARGRKDGIGSLGRN